MIYALRRDVKSIILQQYYSRCSVCIQVNMKPGKYTFAAPIHNFKPLKYMFNVTYGLPHATHMRE
jgi:predicted restriction endonuclease